MIHCHICKRDFETELRYMHHVVTRHVEIEDRSGNAERESTLQEVAFYLGELPRLKVSNEEQTGE